MSTDETQPTDPYDLFLARIVAMPPVTGELDDDPVLPVLIASTVWCTPAEADAWLHRQLPVTPLPAGSAPGSALVGQTMPCRLTVDVLPGPQMRQHTTVDLTRIRQCTVPPVQVRRPAPPPAAPADPAPRPDGVDRLPDGQRWVYNFVYASGTNAVGRTSIVAAAHDIGIALSRDTVTRWVHDLVLSGRLVQVAHGQYVADQALEPVAA